MPFGIEDPAVVGMTLLIIGILLIIAETATPGFFVGVIGTAFVAMGIIGIFFPFIADTPWSPVIVLVVTAGAMMGAVMFYRRLGRTQPTATTITESNVGKEGLVIEDIEPHSLHGKVKIQHQIWSATGDVHIPKGKMVKVVDWEGVHVIVEEVEKKEIIAETKGEEVKT
ncbi:MAG: NfeD family protein [Methanomassiliicoccales archaeon]|nr:MAG: NfeD family protein [Methanomassiliicoccales archaeon]